MTPRLCCDTATSGSAARWNHRTDCCPGNRLATDLQRYLAVQLGIGGLIDLAHAPLANEGGDVVVPEAGTDG